MKRKLILITAIVLAIILATPFFLNMGRITSYEDRVAHILTFKTENWYLSKQIPEATSNVYYNYAEGWGQGSSSNTLSFRLPESASQAMRAQMAVEYSSLPKSDSPRPKIVTTGHYEELVWTAYEGNHGSEGGIWYDAGKHGFVFHHDVW